MQTYRIIDRDALVAALEAGAPMTLVEALPRQYYETGHLPGAIHIPHDEIRQQAPTRLPDRDAPIVVYCASASCQNSRIAADTLVAMGYTQVAAYEGGKQDWQQAGLVLQAPDAAA